MLRMFAPRPAKLATAYCLLLFATGSLAQTVTVLNGGTAKGSNPATKLVAIDISVLNSRSVPISFDNMSFTLTDPAHNVYDSLSGLYKADVKVSEKLWFEVPATLDPQTLRLSMHRRESKNWDDYLEIWLADPVPASAPMWHGFHPGAIMDSFTYAAPSPGTTYKDLTPPQLVHAPDPKLPPEARAKIMNLKDRKVVVTVALVVDTLGNPQQVELVSAPAGMGLDTEALRAVKQYRFKPALDKNGVAVAVEVRVEVAFKVY
jgi:TonB family protein